MHSGHMALLLPKYGQVNVYAEATGHFRLFNGNRVARVGYRPANAALVLSKDASGRLRRPRLKRWPKSKWAVSVFVQNAPIPTHHDRLYWRRTESVAAAIPG